MNVSYIASLIASVFTTVYGLFWIEINLFALWSDVNRHRN